MLASSRHFLLVPTIIFQGILGNLTFSESYQKVYLPISLLFMNYFICRLGFVDLLTLALSHICLKETNKTHTNFLILLVKKSAKSGKFLFICLPVCLPAYLPTCLELFVGQICPTEGTSGISQL